MLARSVSQHLKYRVTTDYDAVFHACMNRTSSCFLYLVHTTGLKTRNYLKIDLAQALLWVHLTIILFS